MAIKRFPVLFAAAALAACVFAMLNATLSASVVCACGTFDQVVVFDLNELDAIIRQYRMDHGGLSPTYSELQNLAASDARLSKLLTPEVDFASRAFTFHISAAEAGWDMPFRATAGIIFCSGLACRLRSCIYLDGDPYHLVTGCPFGIRAIPLRRMET